MNDKLLESVGQNQSDMIHRIIGNTFIIEYGIIKDIPADGIVTVEMSVSDNEENIIITDCVLLTPASKNFAVKVQPELDDKVLVLFPRKFNNDMFNKDKNETIISDEASGYNVLSGIAVLMNQFQEEVHKNFIEFSEGNLKLDVNYDKDTDKTAVSVSMDKDGNIEVSNQKGKVKLDSEGYLKYENTDDNKSKIEFTSSGFTMQDKNGCTITSSSSDIQINGKLKIKK